MENVFLFLTLLYLLGSQGVEIIRTSPVGGTATDEFYRHQKEALDFMTQRETGPIPPEFSLWQPVQSDNHTQ